jgi:hypothetical protein
MISDAQEFVRLRTSIDPQDYLRAATESAELVVWQEVIEKFSEMKVWVVHNKTVPTEILGLLSSDPDPEVRAAVARKNKIPAELFFALARDSDERVRNSIIFNRNVGEAILEHLANDPVEWIASNARQRLATSKRDG